MLRLGVWITASLLLRLPGTLCVALCLVLLGHHRLLFGVLVGLSCLVLLLHREEFLSVLCVLQCLVEFLCLGLPVVVGP